MFLLSYGFLLFFFNDTATTEIYTLSLHDALRSVPASGSDPRGESRSGDHRQGRLGQRRSEEHTSELQSLAYLVCRLLLEKKKRTSNTTNTPLSRPYRIAPSTR